MSARLSVLVAQIIWLLSATIYNILSWRDMQAGLPGWAGHTPVQAQIFVLAFGFVILLGLSGKSRAYFYGSIVVIVLLSIGGIARHFWAPMSDYASGTHWVWAIAINGFGVLAFLSGVVVAARSR